MTARRNRWLVAAATALALAASLVPAVASAGPHAGPGASVRVSSLASGVPTWEADPFDPVDNAPGGARDISALVGDAQGPHGFGKPAFEETHTFELASAASSEAATDYQADEDWFAFHVSDFEVASGLAWLIEAKAATSSVHPVLELYGPFGQPGQVDTATVEATVPALVPGSVDPSASAAATGGPWAAGEPTGTLTSVSFVPTSSGEFFVRVRPLSGISATGSPGYLDGAGPYTLRMKVGQLTRLSGADRVRTAIAVSRETFADGALRSAGSTGAVVIAQGWNYPDALAGSVLSGVLHAPVLLTRAGALDPPVAAEIRRLGAGRAFVLGGPSTLATKVVDDLEAVVGEGNVVRLAGKTRVQTAVEIAEQAKAEPGGQTAKLAFVCNGWSFPDALCAAPMGVWGKAPVLLTPSGSLDASVAAAIDELGITDVVILGGKPSVSLAVENQLKAKLDASGPGHVRRIGGRSRYETAELFAVWASGSYGASATVTTTEGAAALPPLGWRNVAVVTGENFPDALGAGVMAGLSGNPLLLTPGTRLSEWILDLQGVLPPGGTAFFGLSSAPGGVRQLGRSYVYGGTSTVSDPVFATLDSVAGGQP